MIDAKSASDVILDVRTPEEFADSHIEGATLLDFYEESFQNDLSLLDKKTTYYIYCRSGNRSGQTLKMMEDLGFENVYNLDGGVKKWMAEAYPLV